MRRKSNASGHALNSFKGHYNNGAEFADTYV